MKFAKIHPHGKSFRKKHLSETGGEMTIVLDRDANERLQRLRARLPKANDSELISLALKSLEEKMGRIIKRKMIRKIRAMKSEV
jgi:hypothetical protein